MAEEKKAEEQKKEEETPKVEEKTAEEKKEEAPKHASPSQGGEEPKAEEKKEEAKEEKAPVEVPAKFKKIVEEIEKMTVIELNGLVKVFEQKFGVSAQAVAAAPAGGAGEAGGAEEQSIFTVELKSAGGQKIAVIKAVKEILGLGLKEAKDMVEGAPQVMKEGVKKEEAEEIKKKIEAAGGQINLK